MSDSEGEELEYEETTITVGTPGTSGTQQALTFKITSLANEALPLEMLLKMEARQQEISGVRLWEGSLLLCNHLLAHHAHSFAGKRVLELGAGCGIVGLVCASLGAAEVVVTDGDERCMALMTANIAANGLSDRMRAAVLRWGDAAAVAALAPTNTTAADGGGGDGGCDGGDGSRANGGGGGGGGGSGGGGGGGGAAPFDWVVAGDVLYKQELIVPLLTTAAAALGWCAPPAAVAAAAEGARASDAPAATADGGGDGGSGGGSGGGMLLCHIPRAGVEHAQVAAALRALSPTGGGDGGGGGVAVAARRGEAAGVGGYDVCADDAARAVVYTVAPA